MQTPEGMLRAVLGDYVVHDGAGSFWKVSRSVFHRSYAPVPASGGEGE
ncbi:hypothetical protein [Nonomuraea sp. NPDC049141]